MSDEKIKLDLDPKDVLDALKQIAEESKKLSESVEESLGKKASRSVDTLVDHADKGTTKITGFFRNLGTRVKEDLKTAFAAAGGMGSFKIAKDLGEGVKSVFDLERAFDRLNTRLKMSSASLAEFKSTIGTKVAATGQKLQDILPGVETAASRGGVKSGGQLADIGEVLAKVNATSPGEDVKSLSETVIEILKTQGRSVTAQSFKETVDALQGGRVSGAFGTATETATAVEHLYKALGDKQAKLMSSRDVTGLAVMASQAGERGVDVMEQVLKLSRTVEGQGQLKAIFGNDVMKNGAFNPEAMKNVNPDRFGKFSEQILGNFLGMDQADLTRWVKSMQENMEGFRKVAEGANETADQFAGASNNMATKVDILKRTTEEAGRQVGEAFANLGNDILNGHFSQVGKDLKDVASKSWNNKAGLGAGIGLGGIAATVGGHVLNRFMGKMNNPIAKMLGGAAQAEMAREAGITPVFVTNAQDIRGGSPGTGGSGGGGGGMPGMSRGMGLGLGLLGVESAYHLSKEVTKDLVDATGIDDMIASAIYNPETEMARGSKGTINPEMSETQMLEKAVENGTYRGMVRAKGGREAMTNPSSIQGRGGRH